MNYPTKRKVNTPEISEETKSFSNRGMSLEKDINKTNKYYLEIDKAVIYKKPTPVTVVKVDYPDRTMAKITEAYYKQPSTTDYNGIYKGFYIDFEAKECHAKTAFPFQSIFPHQITHLEKCIKHGAIAFIIMRICILDKTYLIKATDFITYYKTSKRQSLPFTWIIENAYEIEFNYLAPCNYLKTVDEVFNI